jgi:hypothetical protein
MQVSLPAYSLLACVDACGIAAAVLVVVVGPMIAVKSANPIKNDVIGFFMSASVV